MAAHRGRRGAVSKHEADGRLVYDKCKHCGERLARLRCLNCCQVQCEQCCIWLHKQPSRRHHKVKPLPTRATTTGIDIRDEMRMQDNMLLANIGTAKRLQKELHERVYDAMGMVTKNPLALVLEKRDAKMKRERKFKTRVERAVDEAQAKLAAARDKQAKETQAKLHALYMTPEEAPLAAFFVTHERFKEAKKVRLAVVAMLSALWCLACLLSLVLTAHWHMNTNTNHNHNRYWMSCWVLRSANWGAPMRALSLLW